MHKIIILTKKQILLDLKDLIQETVIQVVKVLGEGFQVEEEVLEEEVSVAVVVVPEAEEAEEVN